MKRLLLFVLVVLLIPSVSAYKEVFTCIEDPLFGYCLGNSRINCNQLYGGSDPDFCTDALGGGGGGGASYWMPNGGDSQLLLNGSTTSATGINITDLWIDNINNYWGADCSAGDYVRGINTDGTYDCETDTYYPDTNCTVDSSCDPITYDSETTAWDKNESDDFNGSWYNLTDIPAGFADNTDNDTYYPDTNCSVDNSCTNITYDSETSNWDKNYSDDFNGSWYNLTDVPAGFLDGVDNDTDTTYSEDSPYLSLAGTVFGFVESVLNSTIASIIEAYGFFNSINNFTTDLTDGKICIYNATTGALQCDYTDQTGGVGGGNTTEEMVDAVMSQANGTIEHDDAGDNWGINESWGDNRWLDDTTIGNCSGDNSCTNITYDSETSAWDKNESNDFNGSWYNLTDVPAGFVDDVDNDTQYQDLDNFTDTGNIYQDDIGSDCGAGNYSYGVDNDGTLKCREDQNTGGGGGGNTTEEMVDAVMSQANGSITYDDAGDVWGVNQTWGNSIWLDDTDTWNTTEEMQDACGAMATNGDGVDFTYDDGANTLTPSFDCSDVNGNGLGCDGENLELDADISDLNWEADWMIAYSDNNGLVELPFNDDDGKFLMSNGEAALTWETPTDTNANTECSGTTTYFDGEGNCDDISSVYQLEIGSNCGAGNYTYGVENDGTLLCREDQSGSGGGNTTEEMVDAVMSQADDTMDYDDGGDSWGWNETKLNESIDARISTNVTVTTHQTFWAEENAALDNGAYEWAFGNGGAGANIGIETVTDGTITGISLSCTTAGTNTNVSIRLDGVDSGCYLYGTGNQISDTCDVEVSVGQLMTPYTIASGGAVNCVVHWVFETTYIVTGSAGALGYWKQTGGYLEIDDSKSSADSLLFQNGNITLNNTGTGDLFGFYYNATDLSWNIGGM